jgi:predicted outer membrane repeat protein
VGGGLYIGGGFASGRNTVFSHNRFADGGEGIANFATLELINSEVSDNNGFGLGGGIFNAGTLTVVNSTIVGNTATKQGGGIYNLGALILKNSVVSGNNAGSGGGIYNCPEGQVVVHGFFWEGGLATAP